MHDVVYLVKLIETLFVGLDGLVGALNIPEEELIVSGLDAHEDISFDCIFVAAELLLGEIIEVLEALLFGCQRSQGRTMSSGLPLSLFHLGRRRREGTTHKGSSGQ